MKKWKRTEGILGLGMLVAGFLPLCLLPALQSLFPSLDWFLAGGMFIWIVLTAVAMMLIFPKMGDAEQYLNAHYLYMTDYLYLYSSRPLKEAEELVLDMAADLQNNGFQVQKTKGPARLEAVREASRLRGPSCAVFVYRMELLDKDKVAAVLEQAGERIAEIDRTLAEPCAAAAVCFLVRGMTPERMKESVAGYWIDQHKVVLPAAYDLDTGRVSFYTGDEGVSSDTARVQRLISRYVLGHREGGIPLQSGRMTPEQLHSKEILEHFSFIRYLKSRRAEEEADDRILMRMRDGECKIRTANNGGLVYYRTEGKGVVLPFDIDPDTANVFLYDDNLNWCFPHTREIRDERAEVLEAVSKALHKKGHMVCQTSGESKNRA